MTSVDLKTGRNEMYLIIDGVSFYFVYDCASTPTAGTSATIASTRLNPYVLLSHALMANLSMYNSTVAALNAAGYDTLRYDHVGHGNTGTGEDEGRRWDFDEFTRHMLLICERVRPGVLPRGVVGCSMGGVLALRFAMVYDGGWAREEPGEGVRKAGEKIKVVCIGAPGMKSLQESIPKWEERKKMFREQGVGVLAEKTVERWFPEPVSVGVRERAVEMCLTCSLVGYERCAEGIVSYDYEDGLESVDEDGKVEVLVIRGENDEAVGGKGILEDVARRAVGRFVEMKGVGHLPPMHDEKGFERVLMEFLDG